MVPFWASLCLLSLLTPSCFGSRTLDPQVIHTPSSNVIKHNKPKRVGAPVVNLHGSAAPVGQTTQVIHHQKQPGNGYLPGSPKYELQEQIKKGTANVKKTEPQPAKDQVYRCVDEVVAKEKQTLTPDPTKISAGVDECIEKYGAHLSAMEAWAIRHNAMNDTVQMHFWSALIAEVLGFLLVLIVAFMYQRNKKDPDVTRGGMGISFNGDFHYGMFSCLEEPGMSCFTFCCCAIRWADTMRMANFMQFWIGVIVMTLLMMINGFTGGIAALLAWGLAVFYRQKLRSEFGLENNGGKMCLDCCCYCWCACCMAVQEARQLEEAYVVGHPIRKVPAGIPRQ